MNVNKQVLIGMIWRAFKFGDFTLASDVSSSYYIDLRKVTMQQRGIRLIGRMIGAAGYRVQSVGGMATAAIPIIGAVIEDGVVCDRGFYVRSEKKDHGTERIIEGCLEDGDHVLIVDDVATSGRSMLAAAQVAQKQGAVVVAAISVLDREAGAADLFAANGIPFSSLCNIREVLDIPASL